MTGSSPPDRSAVTIPLHVEDLVVERRVVETGVVQVHLKTVTHEEAVDELLTDERIEIERVPIQRVVDSAPPVREEGDTTVISVCEEVVVVERRLVLKEEIRLRRVRTTHRHQETVSLREQEAVIEQAAPGDTRAKAPVPGV